MIKTYEECINELTPKLKDIKFKVDVMEESLLKKISMGDDNIKFYLNYDFTQEFNQYIKDKLEAKEQIKINIKGETRSGKSLIALKIVSNIVDYYNNETKIKKEFDINYIICANQKELRQKINKAKFGDVFQIDENAFTNVGEGSYTEITQLTDINNQIAKENIHMIFITPQKFLLNGATSGLSYFGKDTKNWLSRFLVYSIKNGIPQLLGYVVFDVGKLFREHGCLIYKQLGGCTNPQRITINEIDKDFLEHTSCVDKTKIDIIDKDFETRCPFYDYCKHPLNQYELKKDKWIKREMKGGLGEREEEKYELAYKLFIELAYITEEGEVKLEGEKKTQIETRVKMRLINMTNTKLTGVEQTNIINMVLDMTNPIMLIETCKILNKNIKEVLKDIKNKVKIERKSFIETLEDEAEKEIKENIENEL